MSPMACARWIAGSIALISTRDDLPRAAPDFTTLAPPITRTWSVQVIETPPGLDARIDLFRSDPGVQYQILVLDSQGHFRGRPAANSPAPDSLDGRRVRVARRESER